jgi:acyl-CoA synthetase (AMP-forming)/AMP-acid ligase II
MPRLAKEEVCSVSTQYRYHILESLARASECQSFVRLVTRHGVHETTFGALWQLSSKMKRAFEVSVPSGRLAGILTPAAEMIAGLVGCIRAGRDFVSLPLPGRGQDPTQYSLQIQRIIEQSGAVAVVVESAYEDMLRPVLAPLKRPLLIAERLAESASGGRGRDWDPGELIQFSSGTTGTPKGVRLNGVAIAACVQALLSALRIGDRPEVFCGWIPLSHDMGLIGGLLTTWVGSTLCPYRYICMSPELFVARPSLWLRYCSEEAATVTTAPTFAYQIASSHVAKGPRLDLSNLRAAIVGAEPIAQETLRAFASAASQHGFRETALCPAYGLAEATLAVSMVPPEERWSTRTVSVDGQTAAYVSCGRILDCVTVDAPDIAAGAGPIGVAGPAMCSGFVPSRGQTREPWLDTRDLGVLADGELVVTGRSDDLLCLAGRNVFAWELERAADGSPAVRTGNCAAVADGRGRYVLLFEPRSSDEGVRDDAFIDIRRRLTAVAGLGPSGIGCLRRGTLPKTPSGKMRRSRIAADLSQFIDSCASYTEF